MKYIVHTDGGSRGNPGPSAIGVVIETEHGVVWENGMVIGEGTNNTAEYRAVVEALSWFGSPEATLHDGDRIDFFLDSLLVVSQLNGIYKVKHPSIRSSISEIRMREQGIGLAITYNHIPREQNRRADALVNRALDGSLM